MVNNRRRGRIAENEWAEICRGHRISRTGEAGSDVVDGFGRNWEVKRIKSLPTRIADWLSQSARQKDYGVAFRADRGKWYVIIEADKFLEIYYDE